jgi:hypothetical protein
MLDAVGKGILATLLLDGALSTDAPGLINTHTIGWEEHAWSMVSAEAVGHPRLCCLRWCLIERLLDLVLCLGNRGLIHSYPFNAKRPDGVPDPQ